MSMTDSVRQYTVRRTPYVIIRTSYIPLDKLYIIDESIRQITITLFIINVMNIYSNLIS